MDKNETMFTILIVGDKSVGKTCFLERYISGRKIKTYFATIGINYEYKKIQLNDGKEIKLQIFDAAGSKKFRNIVYLKLKQADGIILIYDITNRTSFNNLAEFLELIRNVPIDEPITILVGNKSDLEEKRAITKEEGINFDEGLGFPFFECSAIENININEIFN